MGMYDEFRTVCPSCAAVDIMQCKWGSQDLILYDVDDAPLVIIAEVLSASKAGKLYCSNCEAPWELKVQVRADIVLKNFESKEWREL